jgi:predicted PurR-regulated permease PerM
MKQHSDKLEEFPMAMKSDSPPRPPQLTRIRDLLTVIILAGVILFATERILSRLHEVVIVLLLAATIVITLNPLVNLLSRRWKRGWAVLAVIVGAMILVFGSLGTLSSIIVIQVQHLARQLPADLQRLLPSVLGALNGAGIHLNLKDMEHSALQNATATSTTVIHGTVAIVSGIVKSLVDTVLIIFMSIYLLIDTPRIGEGLQRLVPRKSVPAFLAVEQTVAHVVGGYVRGQLLLSLVIGLAFGLGSALIGLPDAVLIALVAAVGELIPLLGPVIGAILPLIFALLDHPAIHVPEVLVLLFGVHLLESDVLGPRIMRDQIGLHPVLSVTALLIGATWLGIWGALFAVPTAGIIVAAVRSGAKAWRAYAIDTLTAEKP